MTQEDKKLLLKDLSARLPYGVVVEDRNGIHTLTAGNTEFSDLLYGDKCNIKPYLHSISSMTEEEQIQLGRLMGATSYNLLKGEYSPLKELLEYSYKNHIDLFGLIPKGLALEAPEDMYKN